MAKYLVSIGFDNGDAESGPLVHTEIEVIEASSKKDCDTIILNKYGYGRDSSYCGHSIRLATDEEIKEYEESVKEAESEYRAMVDAGFINPDEDEAMWKDYEETENRRNHLLELADQFTDNNGNNRVKWMINYDDTILIETDKMSDSDIIEYMKGVA